MNGALLKRRRAVSTVATIIGVLTGTKRRAAIICLALTC